MKRLFAVLMSIILLIPFFTQILSFAVSANDLFVLPSPYSLLYLNSNYLSLNSEEINIPDSFDGHNISMVDLKTNINTYLPFGDDTITKSLTYNKYIRDTSSSGSSTAYRYELARFKVLKTVKYLYNGNDFILQSNLAYESVTNNSNSIEDIYIYATGISKIGGANVFRGMNPNLKIHVTSEAIKSQIYDTCKDSNYYSLSRDQIVVDLQDDRKTSSIEINCADINYGTKGGFKPSVTVKLDNVENADLKNQVKLEIHGNAECTDSPSYKYNSDDLALGHYWIKASLDDTDEYKGATAVKEVQVVDPNAAMKLGLDALIKQADAIKSHQGDYYNSAAFLFTEKVIDTDGDKENDMSLYDYAKKVYNDPAAKSTDVTDAMTKLSEALNSDELVLNSDLASPEERSKFVTDVNNNYGNFKEADYTAESWKDSGFGELLNELNTKYTSSYVLTGPVTSEGLSNFKTSIEEASKKLVKRTDFSEYIPALKEAVEKAKAILDDNPAYKYADSQIEALQTAYDAANAILNDAENANRNTIQNATGNLNNAIDGLVEVDRTELLSKLQDAIKEAEAMDSEKETYTAESYKVLTDAIEAAKGITEDSTVTEMQTAIENINSGISGLKKDLDSIQAAKDELSKAVEEAEAIDSSKYTEESYAKVADAIKEAKRLIARQNANLTVSGLKAAQAALEEAIKGLKEKQPEGPSNQKPSNNNNNNGSTNIKKPPVNNNVVVKTTSRGDAVKAAKAKAKSQMKQAKIKKLKVKSTAKKTIKVTWKKVKKAKGYRVQVSTNRKFKKSKIIFEKHTKKKTLKITKKIKSGKTYYVRVSAYTTYKDINGKTQKVYSKNKPLQKVKVK